MGDHVYVRFKLKPIRVDERFLSELDACFAAVDYRPSPTIRHAKEHSLEDRHKALEKSPQDDGVWSAYFGYSTTGLSDATEVHVVTVSAQDDRTIESMQMETHTVSCYFRPDVEIDNDDSDELKQTVREKLFIAKVVRELIPVIHQRFKALRTEAWAGYGEEPFITINQGE